MQCCLFLVDTTLHRLFYSEMLSVNHDENLVQCCPRGSRQHYTGKNLVQYCLIAQEKIQFNVALILLGQHCTGKSFVQCCSRAFRKDCTGKILFNVVLILLEEQCTGKNLVQCCPRGSREHCMGKTLFNDAVILLGQHCTG